MIPSFHNLFQKPNTEGIFLQSFYEVTTTIIRKPDKDIKGNYRPISLMNIDEKFLNKILPNQI